MYALSNPSIRVSGHEKTIRWQVAVKDSDQVIDVSSRILRHQPVLK